MMIAQEMYDYYVESNNDICQHLPTLMEYAKRVDTIVELGVRSICSTWAFMLGRPERIMSVDIHNPSYYKEYDPIGCDLYIAQQAAHQLGINFIFNQSDSIKAKIPKSDLIFFDTEHTSEQLTGELDAHGASAKKYMIFHDTVTYADQLQPVILRWLDNNPTWIVDRVYTNNNGLTILKHI